MERDLNPESRRNRIYRNALVLRAHFRMRQELQDQTKPEDLAKKPAPLTNDGPVLYH